MQKLRKWMLLRGEESFWSPYGSRAVSQSIWLDISTLFHPVSVGEGGWAIRSRFCRTSTIPTFLFKILRHTHIGLENIPTPWKHTHARNLDPKHVHAITWKHTYPGSYVFKAWFSVIPPPLPLPRPRTSAPPCPCSCWSRNMCLDGIGGPRSCLSTPTSTLTWHQIRLFLTVASRAPCARIIRCAARLEGEDCSRIDPFWSSDSRETPLGF